MLAKHLSSRRFCAAAVVLMALVGAGACHKDESAANNGTRHKGPLAFPVQIESVSLRQVDYVSRAVGSIEAFETVQVTSRVAGVVERVRFQEGDTVNVNQVLVEIEPRRFHLSLQAEQAALAKAKAARADAEAGFGRRQAAVEKTPGLIPGEEVATWKTRVATADAEVAAAQAALGAADLNLRDAYVRAPVKGAIETRTVQTGQYVQLGTVLASLIRLYPLMLRFSLPPEAARNIKRGDWVAFKTADANESHRAKITYIAQSADPATRQVPMAAEVENPDTPDVRPGQFAQVTAQLDDSKSSGIEAKTEGNAANAEHPAIPESAIRPSEKGFIAFVVKDGKAQERRLALGLRTADGRVEVREGLQAGELLVVRGAEALRDGVAVTVAGQVEGNAAQGS